MSVHPDPLQFTDAQSQLTRDLITARNAIEKGWVKHVECVTISGVLSFCTLGALEHATDSYWFPSVKPFDASHSRFDAARSAVRRHTPMAIAAWNDSRERTKEDVLAVFDKAIFDSM